MVDARVAQGGVYGLAGVLAEARASQGGVYALISVGAEARVAQAGVQALVAVTADVRVPQAGVYALAYGSPCTTKRAQVWTITRTDGEVFRFTSLDRDLEWMGQTYQSCDSLVPSASESVSEVDAAGNMDLSGAIGPDGITEQALYAGLFDGAAVEAWLVYWSGTGRQHRLLKGTFGTVEQTKTGFNVEILGDGAKLQQTPLIKLIQPDCRFQFGDRFCQKDVGALTVTGTVDSGDGQRGFVDAARAEAAGYFRRGRVTFTSGDNDGISAEIKSHASGGFFGLWPRLPFGISAGDTYEMEPGCSNLKAASEGTNGCIAWNNVVRFGGFDKVPGSDKRSAAADVKAPG